MQKGQIFTSPEINFARTLVIFDHESAYSYLRYTDRYFYWLLLKDGSLKYESNSSFSYLPLLLWPVNFVNAVQHIQTFFQLYPKPILLLTHDWTILRETAKYYGK